MIIKTRYLVNAYGNLDASTLLLPDNGQQWEVSTCKRYNGRLLSTLSKVKVVSDYGIESDWDAQIKSIAHEVKRITKQALQKAHLNALHEFMDFLKMEVQA